MKRFGGILLAVELYTFDQFLGVIGHFFFKKQGGVVNSPGFDQISLAMSKFRHEIHLYNNRGHH